MATESPILKAAIEQANKANVGMGGFTGFGNQSSDESFGVQDALRMQGIGTTPSEVLANNMMEAEINKTNMMNQAAQTGGLFGAIFDTPKAETGFTVGMPRLDATDKAFTDFNRSFNRKWYQTKGIRFDSYDDFLNTAAEQGFGLPKALEEGSMEVVFDSDKNTYMLQPRKMEGDATGSYKGKINLKIIHDAKPEDEGGLSNEAFNKRYKKDKSNFINSREYEYLSDYLPTLEGGTYQKRRFYERPGYGLGDDYEYTGEDLSGVKNWDRSVVEEATGPPAIPNPKIIKGPTGPINLTPDTFA
tara:strand:+ start:821 stop:1726 length:906 start_codon:yes stop_codon:yes gene_type:complete